MFDYLSDQNYFSSLSVTAAVGKKWHLGLPEQFLTEGTQNAEGKGSAAWFNEQVLSRAISAVNLNFLLGSTVGFKCI